MFLRQHIFTRRRALESRQTYCVLSFVLFAFLTFSCGKLSSDSSSATEDGAELSAGSLSLTSVQEFLFSPKTSVSKMLLEANGVPALSFVHWRQDGSLAGIDPNGNTYLLSEKQPPKLEYSMPEATKTGLSGGTPIFRASANIAWAFPQNKVQSFFWSQGKWRKFESPTPTTWRPIFLAEEGVLAWTQGKLIKAWLQQGALKSVEFPWPKGGAEPAFGGFLANTNFVWAYTGLRLYVVNLKSGAWKAVDLRIPGLTDNVAKKKSLKALAFVLSEEQMRSQEKTVKFTSLAYKLADGVYGNSSAVPQLPQTQVTATPSPTKPVLSSSYFADNIKNVALNKCATCHSAASARRFKNVDQPESWQGAMKSEIYTQVSTGSMPSGSVKLTAQEKTAILTFTAP